MLPLPRKLKPRVYNFGCDVSFPYCEVERLALLIDQELSVGPYRVKHFG